MAKALRWAHGSGIETGDWSIAYFRLDNAYRLHILVNIEVRLSNLEQQRAYTSIEGSVLDRPTRNITIGTIRQDFRMPGDPS